MHLLALALGIEAVKATASFVHPVLTPFPELMVAYASMEPLSISSLVTRLAPQAQQLQRFLFITVWSKIHGGRVERYVTSSCL